MSSYNGSQERDQVSQANDLIAHQHSKRGSSLRLIVQSSSVLPRLRRVAVLDGHNEVEVGRDLAVSGKTPRIRLKDMAVSKHHATVFRVRENNEWAIVDMGSKHGTFVSRVDVVEPGPSSSMGAGVTTSQENTVAFRLSQSRQASIPHVIHHMDLLTIGGTCFVVHIHEGGVPCQDCASDPNFDIPLFSSGSTKSGGRTPKRAHDEVDYEQSRDSEGSERDRDPRAALMRLKETLVSRHSSTPDRGSPEDSNRNGNTTKYIDRSAKRRAFFSTSGIGSPVERSRSGTPAFDRQETRKTLCPPSALNQTNTSGSTRSPIPEDNIGHRLLKKQGWRPGTVLGVNARVRSGITGETSIALAVPIQPHANRGRMGLGMTDPQTGDVASIEDLKQKHFDEVRKCDM